MTDISAAKVLYQKQVEKTRVVGVSGDDRGGMLENDRRRRFKNSGAGVDGLNDGLLDAALCRADHCVACVHQGNAGFAGREVEFVIELFQALCQMQ